MKYTTTLQYRRRFGQERDKYISSQWEDSHYPEYQVEGYSGLLLKDGRHQSTPIDFNYNLEMNTGKLEITFSNVTEGRKLQYLVVDPSIFAGADAYTLWYIKDDILDRNLEILKGEHFNPPTDPNTIVDEPYIVAKNDLVNAWATTFINKSQGALGTNSIITFLVLKTNPTPDDILIILVRPRTTLDNNPDYRTPEMNNNNIEHVGGDGWADHITTVTATGLDEYSESIVGFKKIIPDITIGESTTSGEIITVNFTTDPIVEFIYLEQSAGALPKVKIPVDENGNGSFKVITTGLEEGDEVRVKLGFKFWTAKATFTKTI
jgi:hypothetical protein